MAGTTLGGQRAAATNKAKYGDDFHSLIGRQGGKISRGGGFTNNPDLARQMGRIGGAKSRKLRTHCKRGHVFSPDNTRFILHENGLKSRSCRQCEKYRTNLRRLKLHPEPYIRYKNSYVALPVAVSLDGVTRRPKRGIWKRLFKKGK